MTAFFFLDRLPKKNVVLCCGLVGFDFQKFGLACLFVFSFS